MLFRQEKETKEAGMAMLEFALVFPVFALLFLMVAVYGWYWWNQTTAATALHNGVYAAAIRGGDRQAGYDETMTLLRAGLGGAADSYEDSFSIVTRPGWRSDIGTLENRQVVNIPWVGPILFTVKAKSIQRHERFYGGPAGGWE